MSAEYGPEQSTASLLPEANGRLHESVMDFYATHEQFLQLVDSRQDDPLGLTEEHISLLAAAGKDVVSRFYTATDTILSDKLTPIREQTAMVATLLMAAQTGLNQKPEDRLHIPFYALDDDIREYNAAASEEHTNLAHFLLEDWSRYRNHRDFSRDLAKELGGQLQHDLNEMLLADIETMPNLPERKSIPQALVSLAGSTCLYGAALTLMACDYGLKRAVRLAYTPIYR